MLVSIIKHSTVLNKTRITKLLIIIFWCIGILLGCISARRLPFDTFPLMRTLSYSRLSIVGALLVPSLPLLLTAILRLFFKPIFIAPVVFLKAFVYAFVSGCICVAFGASGQFHRFFLTLSATVCNVVLLYFLFQKANGSPAICLRSVFVLCAVIFCADYFVVSRIFSVLLDY